MSSILSSNRYSQHPKVETLDLRQQLKGNQHAVWIKQTDEVMELIKGLYVI
ncbi:hypothetical protein ACFODO_11390 [Acinetobacter sichuanensis]|uniref:Uncharacterized protein n=1 Tax=Acinetobacter sichuanensis TaxID=2136183 RepID=A0ABV7BG61_9GAMM|nr:hypothetical protein [Acinetobacter sichuanensis]